MTEVPEQQPRCGRSVVLDASDDRRAPPRIEVHFVLAGRLRHHVQEVVQDDHEDRDAAQDCGSGLVQKRVPGSRLGPDVSRSLLGSGGMREVYAAPASESTSPRNGTEVGYCLSA